MGPSILRYFTESKYKFGIFIPKPVNNFGIVGGATSVHSAFATPFLKMQKI